MTDMQRWFAILVAGVAMMSFGFSSKSGPMSEPQPPIRRTVEPNTRTLETDAELDRRWKDYEVRHEQWANLEPDRNAPMYAAMAWSGLAVTICAAIALIRFGADSL